MEKINAEFIFALDFAQNLTSILLVFSKEAILFLIYLLADKAKHQKWWALLINNFLEYVVFSFFQNHFLELYKLPFWAVKESRITVLSSRIVTSLTEICLLEPSSSIVMTIRKTTKISKIPIERINKQLRHLCIFLDLGISVKLFWDELWLVKDRVDSMSASHDILRSIGKDVYVAVSIKYIGSWYIYYMCLKLNLLLWSLHIPYTMLMKCNIC